MVCVCVCVCDVDMEQNMVPWKKDKDEKQCQGCGGTFGILRRRHHCRLCGDIICKECSRFMSLQEACKAIKISPFSLLTHSFIFQTPF